MMTDERVDAMCEKLRAAFNVVSTEDVVREMALRFLSWKLPKGFAPDAGVAFVPPPSGYNWPTGTNLLDHEQAKEMVRHMLGIRG